MERKAIKFGDNIDTDVIIPARYLNTSDPEILKQYCMIDIDETFAGRVKAGDVMVGGKNFGCGSSREHAPIAIKASGIDLVIAKTFARIFYRNSINIGLAIVECPEFVDAVEESDTIEFDLKAGVLRIVEKNLEFKISPFPEAIQNIVDNGGLLPAIKNNAI